ncbi:MAG: DUF4430 domain-containing protein [Acutalibacteraceae bacterium]
MKKIHVFVLFFTVFLALSGCSTPAARDVTASSASITTTEYTTAKAETFAGTEASFAETSSTTDTTNSVTTRTTTVQTTVSTGTEAVTSEIQTEPATTTVTTVTSSTAQTQPTEKETETKAKSLWSIFGGSSDKNGKNSTTTKKTVESTDICFVTIRCDTIKNNLSSLKKGKEIFVPKSGVILDHAKVECKSGESAFDVIKRACSENVCTDNCTYCRKGGIQLEYNFTPAFGTYYIEGIHQLYEKDCGSMSGWMFSVNGEFPTEGSSSYPVKPGDEIVFAYTCDMGDDIGNAY